MTTAGITRTRTTAEPATRTNGRLAATTQLAIVAFYLAGVLMPALRDGMIGFDGDTDTGPLWPQSAGFPIQLLHVLGFFAASVGIVVSIACALVCVGMLVRGWRQYTPTMRVLLASAAVLGVAFVVWSATPSGSALRGWIAD